MAGTPRQARSPTGKCDPQQQGEDKTKTQMCVGTPRAGKVELTSHHTEQVYWEFITLQFSRLFFSLAHAILHSATQGAVSHRPQSLL